MDELCNNVYENARIYKNRTKRWHNKHIMRLDFEVGSKVLLNNSRLWLFLGKLRSQWLGPFSVIRVDPYGAVEVNDKEMRLSKWMAKGWSTMCRVILIGKKRPYFLMILIDEFWESSRRLSSTSWEATRFYPFFSFHFIFKFHFVCCVLFVLLTLVIVWVWGLTMWISTK